MYESLFSLWKIKRPMKRVRNERHDTYETLTLYIGYETENETIRKSMRPRTRDVWWNMM